MAHGWLTLGVLAALNGALCWRLVRDPRRTLLYVCAWQVAVPGALALLG